MKPELPNNVHHVQACHRLVGLGNLPFLVTHENRPANEPGSWCTRSIGMELVVYISGNGVLRTPSIINHMHRGAICLIPPNAVTRHIPAPDSRINYWNFLFLDSKLRIGDIFLSDMPSYRKLTEFQGKGENCISPVFSLDNPLLNEIDTVGNDILSEQTFHPQGWQIFCATAFLYLIGRILRDYRKDRQSFSTIESRIEQISGYIERNCSHPLELETLAQKAGMSPSSFSHHFRKLKNISPIEYVIRCRLRKAISMFSYCGNINQIAFECGFTELSYFSRAFRNRIGLTPTQFKNLPIEKQKCNFDELQ